VSKAVVLSAAEETEAYHEKRLRLIDSVYSMDRDFANGLSVLLDDDPARKKMIEENISKKNEEKTNEEEWDVANDEIGKNIYSDKYPDLAWNLVAKLNADNHTPNKQSDFRVYLENINSYDSDDTYPLFSYYIHALGISLLNKDAASKRMRPLFDTIIENVHLFADMYEVSLEGARNRRMESTKQFVVSQSSRNDAVKFIKNWVVDNGENDLNIVDPYFSIDNLEFIAETINRDPNFKLKILTSYSQIKKIDLGGASDIAEAINDYWNTNISTEPMPSIEIIFLGLRSLNLDMPIHDRWWITKNGGLRLGSSMASFGKKPIFEISKLPPEEVIGIEQQVGGFFSGSQNLYEGERVRCLRIIVD
jgi:hypothetical protein